MAEITLKQSSNKNNVVPFVINLENDENGETITHRYEIVRLGNKAAMQVSLLMAEFARDKSRDQLLGSSMMGEILKRTTPVHEKNDDGVVTKVTPEILDVFDNLEDDGFKQLIEALVTAAKSSSVSE